MTQHVQALTRGTLETVPSVCHDCVWWQSSGSRETPKSRWIERAEDEWGAWGTVYYDDDGSLLGSMQYGPAGPVSDDAVLVTCAYLVDQRSPWVMQSLFLAAIGDARDRGAKALEAFAYRYPEGERFSERFLVHKTIFPHDFLSDFGFVPLRSAGRVELARLELGGIQLVEEKGRSKLVAALRKALVPAPLPDPHQS